MASIENYGGELETNRKKVNELEKKLVTEEAELEEVRDSLKGELAAVRLVSDQD